MSKELKSGKTGIKERINKEWLFWDGGTGTLLQERGLKGGELPETWNIIKPEEIANLHRSYLDAGCNIINSNTFGANRLKFPDNLKEITEAAIKIARDVAEETKLKTGRDDIYVSLDIGPTGKLLKPLGDLDFEDAVEIFGEVAAIGEAAGADLVLIETMSDTYELKAAVLGAKENTSLPVCATVTFDAGGKLLTGGDVKTCVALLEGLKVDALGVNCSLGPKELMPIVKELAELSSIPVIVTPNAGLPRSENGKTVYDVGPEDFASLMAEVAGLGVQMLGGCCGTTPEHIRLLIDRCKDMGFIPAEPKAGTYVTSFAKTVEIGTSPKVIGERINPTGKKAFKEALKNSDIGYVLNEGIKQEDSGADILDVNVGLPEIDEPEMMAKVIAELQAVTPLPLQIDTADSAAMERGLRIYNGKAMVNSVNGKKESMDAVFPLVAKYGGVVVALTLDEDGIPETAEGRVAIAKKIVEEAARYGIPKKDIVVDALTLAISSGKGMARSTLDAIGIIKNELGLNTILGVSNVSFGLPGRELINAHFLSMAMERGLSCAIINPGNEAIMDAFRASKALLDFDENCAEYIEAASSKPSRVHEEVQSTGVRNGSGKTKGSDNNTAGTKSSLRESIERGLSESARDAAILELETREPLDIINEELIPALDSVGQGFEKGTVFLPQLLMSAEATKAAFEIIKKHMPEKKTDEAAASSEGKKTEDRKIIVATVKGDIHDIGKNIVKVLLENYGFDVVDLGRDVPPEMISEEAKKRDIKLVGLSALMTTTVSSMQETIKLLRAECPGTKVVVSGAVLTQEYADMMGADHYAKDAMGTVRYAEAVLA